MVNNTFKGDAFQNYFKRIKSQDLFFIGDECHHHNSKVFNNLIPKDPEYLLGLSATPYGDFFPEIDKDEVDETDEELLEEFSDNGETTSSPRPLLLIFMAMA